MTSGDGDLGAAFAIIAKRELDTLSGKANIEFDRLSLENKTRIQTLENDNRTRLNEIQERTEKDIRSKGYAIGAVVIALAVLGVLSGVLTARHEIEQSVIDLNKDVIAAQSVVLSSRSEVTKASGDLLAAREQMAVVIKSLTAISEDYKKQTDVATSLITELAKSRDEYRSRVANLSSFDPTKTEESIRNLNNKLSETQNNMSNTISNMTSDTKMILSGKNVCPEDYRSLGAILVGINSDYSGPWGDVLEVAKDDKGNTLRLSSIIDSKWVIAHPTVCIRK